jgi:hypothetical protein
MASASVPVVSNGAQAVVRPVSSRTKGMSEDTEASLPLDVFYIPGTLSLQPRPPMPWDRQRPLMLGG